MVVFLIAMVALLGFWYEDKRHINTATLVISVGFFSLFCMFLHSLAFLLPPSWLVYKYTFIALTSLAIVFYIQIRFYSDKNRIYSDGISNSAALTLTQTPMFLGLEFNVHLNEWKFEFFLIVSISLLFSAAICSEFFLKRKKFLASAGVILGYFLFISASLTQRNFMPLVGLNITCAGVSSIIIFLCYRTKIREIEAM
jgi:hypothetical protein